MEKKYYAVRKGRTPGIYATWDECKAQVTGYKGAEYKKFKILEEAENFLNPSMEAVDPSIAENELIAYVDGSFNQDTNVFAYGVVLIDSIGNELTFNEAIEDPKFSEHRNVAGEVYGAVAAIRKAIELNKKKLYLHYDYMGISAWARGEWKTNKELTKAYKRFIDSVKDKIHIEFVKVKAHSNDKYNDIADRLAKDACGVE